MIEATLSHAPVLALMHKTAFPGDPWDTASFMQLLRLPGMHGLLDERGGFVLIQSIIDEAEIITLGVTAPRQGLGRAMLRAAIAHAQTIGVTKIHLVVAARNTAARALYAAENFVQAGRRRAYYPDGSDALTLTRVK